MSQTFTSTDVVSTTNVFADNQSQRTNENTLRSTFSGTTQPSDPVVGQQWYDTANSKTMQYNGTAWVPIDTNGTTQVDVSNAKGSLTSLTSYLRVAHNDDGTLKSSPATAIDEFKDNALAITYISPTSFTVPSDLTSIFTTNRKVKVSLSASTAISYVTSSTFSTVTTVTLGSPVLDATVTAVKYSIIQDGMPQDYSLALAESTGYGIVSGCTPSISGLTVTVASGVVHLPDGTRKELSASTITLDAADTTNPRINLVYITSAGVVAKVTGTAAATPSAPALPTDGISVAQINVAANATTGIVSDARKMLARWYDTDIVNVRDFGAVGDGVTDDTVAIQRAVDYSIKNKRVLFIPKTNSYYKTVDTIWGDFQNGDMFWLKSNGATVKLDSSPATRIPLPGWQIYAVLGLGHSITSVSDYYNDYNTSVFIEGLNIDGAGIPFTDINSATGENVKLLQGLCLQATNIKLCDINVKNVLGEGIWCAGYTDVYAKNINMDNVGGRNINAIDNFGDGIYLGWGHTNATSCLENLRLKGNDTARHSRIGIVSEYAQSVETLKINNAFISGFDKCTHIESSTLSDSTYTISNSIMEKFTTAHVVAGVQKIKIVCISNKYDLEVTNKSTATVCQCALFSATAKYAFYSCIFDVKSTVSDGFGFVFRGNCYYNSCLFKGNNKNPSFNSPTTIEGCTFYNFGGSGNTFFDYDGYQNGLFLLNNSKFISTYGDIKVSSDSILQGNNNVTDSAHILRNGEVQDVYDVGYNISGPKITITIPVANMVRRFRFVGVGKLYIWVSNKAANKINIIDLLINIAASQSNNSSTVIYATNNVAECTITNVTANAINGTLIIEITTNTNNSLDYIADGVIES